MATLRNMTGSLWASHHMDTGGHMRVIGQSGAPSLPRALFSASFLSLSVFGSTAQPQLEVRDPHFWAITHVAVHDLRAIVGLNDLQSAIDVLRCGQKLARTSIATGTFQSPLAGSC